MKKIAIIAAFALALCAFTLSAQATTIIDFTVPGNNPTGAVSYDGGAASALSTFFDAAEHPITISQVETLLPSSGPFTVTDGQLTFTSGAFDAVLSDPEHWGFGAGGSITLTGSVTIGSNTFTGTILTGSFTQMLVSKPDPTTGANVMVANFTDTKDKDFLALFGLSPDQVSAFGNFNIGLQLNLVNGVYPIPDEAFSSLLVTSGDVKNNPIPLPPSMVLLGSGLLALVGFGIRRRQG